MKKFIYATFIVFIVVACSSSSIKNLQKGNYDKAIDKSIKELLKDPTKDEEIKVLSQAYLLANQNDNQKIEQLKLSGQPDIWDQIYSSYNALQNRQEKVARLAQVINLNYIGYQNVNYNNEITNAKNKAAEYFYVHAKTLLDKGDKYSARTAYDELQKTKSYFPNYKDVDDLIKIAYNKGNTYVLFKIENNSQSILPVAFEEELCKTSLADINQKWTIYDSKPLKDFFYDYYIIVNIKLIDISPENLNQNHYTESKQVADGWSYKLDKNGNVMKDSLGNDIKIPKFKTISCNINEVQQSKAIIIAGTLDFINNANRQIIKTDPIRAEWFFKNAFTTASGDMSAITPQTAAKLQSTQMLFPPNADMILQAGNVLKNMTKDIIRRNNYLLK
ncbi:MAG: hypothetical protein HXX18_04675 [Bacteroidetes bacterium]|nr:hypothetical protein [Bacteroidota bacterium]